MYIDYKSVGYNWQPSEKNKFIGYNWQVWEKYKNICYNWQNHKVLLNISYNCHIGGYNVTIGKAGEKEIDFIAEKAGDKMYIQGAYLLPTEDTINREFGVYENLKDN